ncbi:unnamed protein product [Nezara viridula]|uniref:Lipocalin/cytosolic fatty-acid binding domain-containing protein n=1 Tax=Nezara viridula TaxID=85310 RepID=A0A9P0H6D7_NEZVI|nr:unnamed protein product [Nezara viridula]
MSNYYLPGKSLAIELFIVLGLLNICGGVVLFGQCLGPPVVQTFEPGKFFSGTWYEIQSYGNELFQGFGTCSGLVSRVTEDNQIALKTYSYQPILQNYITIDGRSDTKSIVNGVATLPIRFDIYGGLLSNSYQAHIIDTDYDNFAVAYLCQQRFFIKSEMAYVLSRQQNSLNNQFSTRINNALYAIGLTTSNLLNSINSNCGTDQPIV